MTVLSQYLIIKNNNRLYFKLKKRIKKKAARAAFVFCRRAEGLLLGGRVICLITARTCRGR